MEKELSNSRGMSGIWESADRYETGNQCETDHMQAINSMQGSDSTRPADSVRVVDSTNEPKYVQTRRVGSVTFGITLVCYGILFLVHIFMPMLRYSFIFRCWPVIFILLGGEILTENYKCRKRDWKLVYDFPAVLMLGAMLLFAMIMAAIDFVLYYETNYGTIFF